MRRQVMDGLIISAVLLGASHLYGQAYGRKVVRPNPDGGTTASAADSAQGPDGGGANVARAGSWTRTADGTLQHQSGFALSGTRGNASNGASLNRSADDPATAALTTDIQTISGTSDQGHTIWLQGGGVTHSAACTDGQGVIAPCAR